MKFQNHLHARFLMNGRTDARTHKPKPICPVNFFEVGGIDIKIKTSREDSDQIG